MRQTLPTAGETAISSAVRADSVQPNTTVQSDAQTGSEFFASVCKTVLGKDAGLHLHYATNVPERSCYRYASGEREVPVLVLRAVMRGDQGEPFHAAFMDGCRAQWWLDLQHQARIGRQVLEITKRE